MRVRKHIYGSVTLQRAKCPDCKRYAIIIDGKLQCCDRPVKPDEATFAGYKRESPGYYRRKLPPLKHRKAVLAAQRDRCFYCDRLLGSFFVTPRGKLSRLRVHWDHAVPYVWSANNSEANFVAACHQCNLWKGSRIFKSIEDARAYLFTKLERYNAAPDGH